VSIKDQFQIMDTLIKVVQETGLTTLFVEHDMEVVQRYGRRVLAFNDGRVIADGGPEAVLTDPEVRKAVLGRA
jgi:branched-chain amino acid transport system ATP-binding protein